MIDLRSHCPWTRLILLLSLSAWGLLSAAAGIAQPQPNIVLIVVDDAALMDLGAYGGEARTPHIDALAERGALFTHYRTSPLCAPSRAMLLTGLNNHQTGVASIPEILPQEHKNNPAT
ncbi:sulfatase-like hydrolase/transferase [Kineobactrum sediminis]|uniref:sulfatase-like hydrolase/transferase n=1 Tax=Kineobactrum sediminis TaxID=1905677 RepID=UPI0019D497B7|nr:sulfatase-like hydrolase/transferase [Kineobactrum sediminis]